MDNMKIYNELSTTPEEAKRKIKAGRLKGFTDINPMWRIKMLTKNFGPCGHGWKYEIVNKYILDGANNEKKAFVDINLFVKIDGEWSDAIPGTGGASFVSKEQNGLYTDDECFKKALTDAIGVAGKALGLSADIYFSADNTKYTLPQDDVPTEKQDDKPIEKQDSKTSKKLPEETKQSEDIPEIYKCCHCGAEIEEYLGPKGSISVERHCNSSKKKFGDIYCLDCINKGVPTSENTD